MWRKQWQESKRRTNSVIELARHVRQILTEGVPDY